MITDTILQFNIANWINIIRSKPKDTEGWRKLLLIIIIVDQTDRVAILAIKTDMLYIVFI